MDKQTIIWGEHRTEEFMALDIAKRLMQDKDLEDRINFFEFKPWRLFDYIPVLKQLGKKGYEYPDECRYKYRIKLAETCGLNALNLHDGIVSSDIKLKKFKKRNPDISIIHPFITYYDFPEEKKLFFELSKKH